MDSNNCKETAEVTKIASGQHAVKLLRPAMEALRAQKVHTFWLNAEVFQNPRTLLRWTGRSVRPWGAGHEKEGSEVSQAVSDQAHLCANDAVRRRASDVGSAADGP